MKTLLQYSRLLLYIISNWNTRVGFFMLYHDIRGALKYGSRKTFVPVPLDRLTLRHADITRSSHYEAVSFYMLEKLFIAFQENFRAKSIIDLGCGKGRVMVVAAHHGFIRVTGIDIAKELCQEAVANMRKTGEKFPGLNWQVLNGNVLNYDIKPDDSVFFMFNPFTEDILLSFLNRLAQSCSLYPRKTWFIYANPQYADILKQNGYKTVCLQQRMHHRGEILLKE